MTSRKDPNRPPLRTEPTVGLIDGLDEPAPPMVNDGLPHIHLEPIDTPPPRQRMDGEPRRGSSRRPPPRRSRRSRRGGWLIPLMLLLVIAVGTATWLNQDSLRGMLPRTDLNDVLARAQSALDAGRLDGSDGTSARELYQAARALEPDNDRARDGLREVGQAELTRAITQLGAGQLDEASKSVSAARELLGGGSAVDAADRAIASARGAQVPTGDVVDQAREALAQGQLDGASGAAALFQRVLVADPGNAVAIHGMDQVGAAYAAQARKALNGGDSAAASISIEKLAALLPQYNDLPALRGDLSQQQAKQGGALTTAVQQGDDALREGRITGEGDDTALAHYQAALAIDPENAQAKAGLGKVAQALTVQASAMLDAGDADQARSLLDQAEKLAPNSADLASARARLGAAATADMVITPQNASPSAKRPAEDDTRPPPPPVVTPEQSAQVGQLISQAQAAADSGHLMMPPGQNAYDLYRSALAIDGNNVRARSGLEGLPTLAQSKFNQNLGQGNLEGAANMLGTLGDLAPGNPAQFQLTRRLAGAWLDQAEQQLSRGDRPGASQSLDQARKLTPTDPRLPELAGRLAAGR